MLNLEILAIKIIVITVLVNDLCLNIYWNSYLKQELKSLKTLTHSYKQSVCIYKYSAYFFNVGKQKGLFM